MKLILRILCITFLGCFSLGESKAQCPAGYISASLNWDALEYLPTTGYSNTWATALSPKQNFAFGKNRLNITYSGGVSSVGENGAHTGSTNSYGVGADVQFSNNGTVTLTFATAVRNLKFSVYDIDKGQVITFSASNAGTSVLPVVSKANSTSTDINITSTVTTSTVTSVTSGQSESSNTTSVNIDIAGDVTSVTMVITQTNSLNGQADVDYWLSDISACISNASFPNNYYSVSQPFTGQPGYILVAANKSIYMVDPVTGKAKFVFNDGATSGTLNSVAYDPYNKVIYYCWSLTNNGSANASGRSLYKYDFNTKTATRIIEDITSLGIPTFDQGVESGAAAFYDGALYLGIEGGADNGNGGPKTTTTGKESIIWRLDLTNGVPTTATQVYAVSGDTHDWSDFSINNGVLYDFNGDATTPDYHHLTMQTGDTIRRTFIGTAPKQSAVGWDGTVYWVNSTVARYNYNGSIGTQVPITSNPAIPNWSTSSSPSFGDAAEAFRPQADFGDAPASYDPDPLAPALHEEDANLKLGTNMNVEWNKMSVTNTDTDDDGLAFVTIVNTGLGNYMTEVNVFNNTGGYATLCAWIDFNKDGIFQSGEGVTDRVPTSTTTQRRTLYWPVIPSLPQNTDTYLRIRITSESATTPMTTSNATGYFANGEVEDYRVLVNTTILAADLKSFTAVKEGASKAKLTWNMTGETTNTIYELQRSDDGVNWNTIYTRQGFGNKDNATYTYTDVAPIQPKTYYRIKYYENGNSLKYSPIQQLSFGSVNAVSLFPNPTYGKVTVSIEAEVDETGQLTLFDINGKATHSKALALKKGSNSFDLPLWHLLPGIYHLQLYMAGKQYVHKLIIQKK